MLDAIACEWLTGGGTNDAQNVKLFLRDYSSTDLAKECIEGWALDEPANPRAWQEADEAESHMARHEYDADDLREAFERLYDAWLRPVAHLPTDQVEAFIDFAMSGAVPQVETRAVDGSEVTCIWSESESRACIGISGSGNGNSDWTDAGSLDDAFDRYANDELAA
jgi:hypothetical protein